MRHHARSLVLFPFLLTVACGDSPMPMTLPDAGLPADSGVDSATPPSDAAVETSNADGGSDTPTLASCRDEIANGTETDVDCGGECPSCGLSQACGTESDCTSGFCADGVCVDSCNNGVQDEDEPGVDCGPVCGRSCESGLCETQTVLPMLECLALESIYLETGGPSVWSDSHRTTWRLGDDQHVCSVDAITCDEVAGIRRVTEVDLNAYNLVGAIPSGLRYLEATERLSIDTVAGVRGELPAWLGELTNLVVLIIRGMREITGAVPSSLNGLTRLASLSLDGNSLSGAIPDLSSLAGSLRTLDLENNELTGELPPHIGNLTELRDLRLGVNELSGTVPPEFGRLTFLRTLFLNSAGLAGALPLSFTDLAETNDMNLRVQGNGCFTSEDASFTAWASRRSPDWNDGC